MERSKNPSWKIVGVRLSISLALVAFLIFIVDISSMKQALLSINMGSVFFIILVCFIQMMLAGLRWFLIGRMTGPFLSATHIFQINFPTKERIHPDQGAAANATSKDEEEKDASDGAD